MEPGPDVPGKRLSVTLELVRGSDPIRGRLLGGAGGAEDFVGWLGLAAAIERLANTGDQEPEGNRSVS